MTARRHLPALLLGVLLLAHAGWLLAHVSAGAQSPDAHGYLLQARLLAEGQLPTVELESPAQLVGTHWGSGADESVLVSRYPPGYPVLLALARALAGHAAMFLVGPLLATATLVGVYSLAARARGPWAGLVAALVVATAPPFDFYALNADAHTPVTFCLVVGLALLFRHVQARDEGRTSMVAGVAAGVALGAVPAMRYPEAACLAPILGYLLARKAARWPGVGAALSVGGLLLVNRATYGAWGVTGYRETNEESAFALANVGPNLAGYLEGIPRDALGPWALLAAVGLGAWGAGARGADRANGAVLLGCIAANWSMYAGFYFGPSTELGGDQTALRYLLPTLPLLVVCGVYVLWAAPWRRAVVAGAVAVQLGWSLPGVGAAVGTQAARAAAAARFTAATAERAPDGSTVVAPVPLAEILDVTGRWRVAGAEVLTVDGKPIAVRAVGRTPDSPAAKQTRPGRWTGLEGMALREAIVGELRAWSGGLPVLVWTDRPDELRAWLPAGWGAEQVGAVALPELRGTAVPGRAAGEVWSAWQVRRVDGGEGSAGPR